MHQAKKGREWHFGMKAHVGTDLNGLVHTLVTTDAAQADISQLPPLLHGQERELYGDQAYWSEFHRIAAQQHGVRYRVNRRPNPAARLTSAHQRQLNRLRSATRARCEHAFHVVKCLWGFTKVRYRGLAKNTAPTVHRLCAGQSVSGQTTVAAHVGDVSMRFAKTDTSSKASANRLPAAHSRCLID